MTSRWIVTRTAISDDEFSRGKSMDSGIKSVLIELRGRFEEIYGQRLAEVILYGSQARGEAAEGSDLDILIVLRGPVNPGEEIERCGEMTAEVSLRLGMVVSCVFMSEDDFSRRQGPFLRNVRREGVTV